MKNEKTQNENEITLDEFDFQKNKRARNSTDGSKEILEMEKIKDNLKCQGCISVFVCTHVFEVHYFNSPN